MFLLENFKKKKVKPFLPPFEQSSTHFTECAKRRKTPQYKQNDCDCTLQVSKKQQQTAADNSKQQ